MKETKPQKNICVCVILCKTPALKYKRVMLSCLADLGVAKVHLGMLRLEFLEDIHLLLLIRSGKTGLLLSLVEHHLLDHPARFAVEVRELGGIRLNLAHVDLGRTGDHVCPPLHLVHLVEVNLDRLGAIAVRHEGPGRVFGVDFVGGFALAERRGC